MKHLVLSDNMPRRLAFYLAMEEWAASSLPADEYFFAWRVAPTVICGRNQDIEKEVNLAFCRDEGIDVVRRRSGGGCVYADMNNWMFSYITPSTSVASTFSRYTSMVARMLGSLGFDAHATGRNDIFIGDRKVAGNAYYHLPERSIVHGTMLCDVDLARMSQAITPSRSKLESKAVKSVQSHVTCLKAEGMTLSVEYFGQYAIEFLCDGDPLVVSADDIARIEALEQRYYAPEYIRIADQSVDSVRGDVLTRHRRIEGVGEFDVTLLLSSGTTIADIDLKGDYFVVGDVEALIATLRGVSYDLQAISDVVAKTNPSAAVAGLTHDDFISLLI